MSDEMPLRGCAVLVVDDDFYLAEDAREALEEAGAVVLGRTVGQTRRLGLWTNTRRNVRFST
jgi:hypothetical protein